jgi:hypothetical protein
MSTIVELISACSFEKGNPSGIWCDSQGATQRGVSMVSGNAPAVCDMARYGSRENARKAIAAQPLFLKPYILPDRRSID